MRTSKYYINTLKEAPSEAEIISHKLMLKSGLIKRVSSGIYTWLPLGLKVLRKIENIVRDEINKVGALEILMPAVQPAELWVESGRWEFYGKELLRIKDRHERDFCFGPTHEEVVVDLAKKDIKSYKQLPFTLYQIQTKFRDEVRPRFGVMRAREFIMKDAYSFHADFASLQTTYTQIYQAYSNIFTRLGLAFRAVNADTGSIGGTGSHEFQVLADSGEDILAYSEESSYAANIELAEAYVPKVLATSNELKLMEKVATPQEKTCEEVAKLLNIDIKTTVKSLVFEGVDSKPVLLLIRGDRELNEVKASKLKELREPLTFASLEAIADSFSCKPGFIGPVGFNGVIIADREVSTMSNFVCGANNDGFHYINVNWGKNSKNPDMVVDLRNVVAGDITPDGKGKIKLCRGIEVGHIFQLRTKYSQAMNFTYLDQNGKSQLVEMGCYGIGVSRIIGAAIEQNNDENGIVFPINMAPFEVAIIPVNYHKSEQVKLVANEFYEKLKMSGIDVLLDDRNERIGSMLADSELIGIPYRIVIGEKALINNEVEFYTRKTRTTENIALTALVDLVAKTVSNAKKV